MITVCDENASNMPQEPSYNQVNVDQFKNILNLRVTEQ